LPGLIAWNGEALYYFVCLYNVNGPMSIIGTNYDSRRQQAHNLFDEGKFQEAFECYLDLAEKGDIHSQCMVAWMYHRAKGVTGDVNKAEHWYRLAADRGDAQSAYWLAILLNESGDPGQANDFLALAADRDYTPAMYSIAVSYFKGRGVSQDIEKGLYFLEQAAKRGNVKAGAELAKQLIRGRRGTINRIRGIFMAARVFVKAFKIALRNREDERLRY
jgi:TPR repeat protein